MHIGAITSGLLDRPLKEAARRLQELGLQHVELPAGGFFPKAHCDPEKLLADPAALDQFRQTLADCDLTISAYALHGQPLHPDPKVAENYRQEFLGACILAEKTGVNRFTLLAGLPAAADGDRVPNWIVFPFPPANVKCLQWQWEQRVIPYWREHAKIASDHGVRICVEMCPADVVHNPEGLLRLRDAVGPSIGANLDPSHFFWQSIDPIEVVRHLGDAIYYIHAKDSHVDRHVARHQGVLDATPFNNVLQRSWLFRTVGYGHGEQFWRNFVSALRLVGYDDVVSIEHEDPLIDPDEGFASAVDTLRRVMIQKPPAVLWDA
jgi:sugar phosphate isomerase/epimerase